MTPSFDAESFLSVTLTGAIVRLVPLAAEHFDELGRIGLDAELWRATTIQLRSRDEMAAYLRDALEARRIGTAIPWVIVSIETGEVIGTTRFHSMVTEHRRLEIGFTWLVRAWQRTAANTEAKYLLLRHAFEELQCNRVEFKADAENAQSLRALRRIGATEEAVLRSFKVSTRRGPRDLILFSMIAADWPTIRRELEGKLQCRGTTVN